MELSFVTKNADTLHYSEDSLITSSDHVIDGGIKTNTIVRIDAVLSALSLAGSGFMISSFLLAKHHRSRRQIIFGLAVSDFFHALSVFAPTVATLARNGWTMPAGAACTVSGYTYQVFVLASAFWTLLVAICTYYLLSNPFSIVCELLHDGRKYVPFLWLLIYVFCFVYAGIGWGLYGYSPVGGGICNYGVNSGWYGTLALFVPRTIIFLLVISIYVYLFCFFRRRANNFNEEGNTAVAAAKLNKGYTPPTSGANDNKNCLFDPSYTLANTSSHPDITMGEISIERLDSNASGVRDARDSQATLVDGAVDPQLKAGKVEWSDNLLNKRQGSPFPSTSNLNPSPYQRVAVSQSTFSPLPIIARLTSSSILAPQRPTLTALSLTSTVGATMSLASTVEQPVIQRRRTDYALDFGGRAQPENVNGAEKERRGSHEKRLTAMEVNRRVSLLMILYPVAYLVIFSVSLAKMIYELAWDHNLHYLSAIARFLIFSQGLIDAVIYVGVEAAFKKAMASSSS
ncbi:family A G protein-coupled receptor-like protein [Atractiella rhizophila]|nr:family A G protein-coupled receptor-like protein [Atractiella rhizophila]